jgi:hypothetical protein
MSASDHQKHIKAVCGGLRTDWFAAKCGSSSPESLPEGWMSREEIHLQPERSFFTSACLSR